MFTGIIKEMGQVKEINSNHGDIQIMFSSSLDFIKSINEGDSISVNGVCLTAYNIKKDTFCTDVSNQTLDVTNIASLQTGAYVNLEPSLSLSSKLGGHFVSGHVDCIGEILDIKKDSRSYQYTINVDKNYTKYIVSKCSIAIDGVSLTVNDVANDRFMVNIIPYTFESTIFKNYKLDAKVNIEIDRIAMHIEKLLDNK